MPRNRDHLTPEIVTRKDGVSTTVHKNNSKGKAQTKIDKAAAVSIPSAVVHTPEPDEVEEPKTKTAPLKHSFDASWGSAHLNRASFRVLRNLYDMPEDKQRALTHELAERTGKESQHYASALGTAFKGWRRVAGINPDSVEPELSVNADDIGLSDKKHQALTLFANDRQATTELADYVNGQRAEDQSELEPGDIRAAIELLRDATSDEGHALQTRAYAHVARRRDIQEQITALQAQSAALEAPLRALQTEQTEGKYSYDISPEDEAGVTFTPSRTFNRADFEASLSKAERKAATVSSVDIDLAKKNVGKERVESFMEYSRTNVSIS